MQLPCPISMVTALRPAQIPSLKRVHSNFSNCIEVVVNEVWIVFTELKQTVLNSCKCRIRGGVTLKITANGGLGYKNVRHFEAAYLSTGTKLAENLKLA